MNVLFVTLADIRSILERGIYQDLLREFERNGHRVFIVSPFERRFGKTTQLLEEENCKILKVRIGNIQKTNIIEKGISTVLLESQFKKAVKRYFSDVIFDLVLYSTPPVTLAGTIAFIKKRDGAETYLMLKDIFPQNSADLGMLKKSGLRGLLYRYFRRKERKLYALSDRIGCMSRLNAEYIIKNNPEIRPPKVGVCPNSIEVCDTELTAEERRNLREKYGIPQDKIVFVYGGNLGRPQDVPFIIGCLRSKDISERAFFLIVGSGTEAWRIEKYVREEKPPHVGFLSSLLRDEYERLTAACDVGLIFLDHRFTVPNFPSRLLSYMQAKLPVLACTDRNTDLGEAIEGGSFGWWCESNDSDGFVGLVNEICASEDAVRRFGKAAYEYLCKNYSVGVSYRAIMDGFGKAGERVFSKRKILYADEKKDFYIGYRKGSLYVRNAGEKERKIRLFSGVKHLLSKSRLFERLMRLEPRCAAACENGALISCGGRVIRCDAKNGSLTPELKFRGGMHDTLSFCQIRDLKGFPDCVCFGDYWGNPKAEEASVWARTLDGWKKAFSFPAGHVKHIHGIVADTFRSQLIILTGDSDGESGIWSLKSGFSGIEPILKGSQKCRACVAFPMEIGILYATDTPLEENGIYLAYEDGDGWSSKLICPIPGPCIYGASARAEDGKVFYLFATSVEPDSRLGSLRYLFARKPGPGVSDRYTHLICGNIENGFKETARYKKDIWPMALFQFGNMQFPAGSMKNILLTPQSTVKYDGKTVVISL